MGKVSRKTRLRTGIASAVTAVLLPLLLYLIFRNRALAFLNEIFLVSLLIAIIPSAILDYLNQRWTDSIEDQMPTLVRGVSESQETGMTIIEAFDSVVDNKMVRGPLSQEVKRITDQMSWGLSFEDALRRFGERIASPVVTRFCALVLEASVSGGQIRSVFQATAGFMEEMRQMDKEASANMRTYLTIIYAAFFVFLITSIVLVGSFFAPLEGFPQMVGSLAIVGVREFKDFFYRTMLISGLMGGLMAGKIGERRVVGGLKHAIVLVVAGYLIFYLMIPPNWKV